MLALAMLAGLYFVFIDGRLITPYRDSFRNGDRSGWTFYGGSWTTSDGTLDNLSGARGDKAIVGNRRWSDYVVETDVRLNADPADSLYGDAGVIIRVTDPATGVDSYDGYYAGVGSDGSILLLGRANYTWVRLASVPLGVEARRGSWFHLKVLAKGCYFEAAAEDAATHRRARLTYFDPDCTKRAGAAGVRTYGLPASWKNFEVHQAEN